MAKQIEGEQGRAGMGGLDRSYARDGIRVNYGEKQMK